MRSLLLNFKFFKYNHNFTINYSVNFNLPIFKEMGLNFRFRLNKNNFPLYYELVI